MEARAHSFDRQRVAKFMTRTPKIWSPKNLEPRSSRPGIGCRRKESRLHTSGTAVGGVGRSAFEVLWITRISGYGHNLGRGFLFLTEKIREPACVCAVVQPREPPDVQSLPPVQFQCRASVPFTYIPNVRLASCSESYTVRCGKNFCAPPHLLYSTLVAVPGQHVGLVCWSVRKQLCSF